MMKHRPRRQAAISLSISCTAMLLLISSSVHAQTWDGGGADDNWSTPLNWSPDGAPANDASASINLAGSTRLTPVVDTPWLINSLNFAAGSDPFSLSGQELTTHAGGIANLDNDLQTIHNAMKLGASQTWNANQGNLLFEGPVDLNSLNLTVTGGFDTTINGAVTGGTLSKSGTGKLTLTNPGTNAGLGDFVNGTLSITGGGALTKSASTLRIGGSEDGALEVDGSGTTLISSGNLNTAFLKNSTLNITDGAVVSNVNGNLSGNHAPSNPSNNRTATVLVDGTGSQWNNSGGLAIANATFSGNASLTIQNGGVVSNLGRGEIAFSGDFDVGTVVVDGAGSVWTNGADLLVGRAGGPSTARGVLTVRNGGAVDVAGALQVGDFGTVELLGGSITTEVLRNTFGGTLTWTAGTLGITGAGGVSLGTGFGDNRPLGANRTLAASQTLEVANTTTIESTGSLTLDGGTLRTGALTLDPGSVFNFNAGTLHVTNGFTADNSATNQIFGGLPQITAGQNLEVTGTTTINAGNLLILNGGTWSTGSLANGGSVLLNAGTFNLTNSDLTVGATGQFGATADFNSATAVNVTNGNLIVESGGVLNSNGTLAAQGGTNAGQINAINATLDFGAAGLANNGQLNLINTTVNGTLANNGSTAVSGTATFTGNVSGDADYTGGGTVVFEGNFSPGNSPGVSTFGGAVHFGSQSGLLIEIAGDNSSTPQFDQVQVTADVSLDSVMDITLLGGFVPKYGEQYSVLTYGSRTGAFDKINGVVLGVDRALVPVYDFAGSSQFTAASDSLTLFVTAPGDANLDLKVNSADFGLLAVNFNQAGGWQQGDFNGDGLVNSADFGLLAVNFNKDFQPLVGTSFDTATTIPEPGTVLVLLLNSPVLLRRRFRVVNG